MVWDEWYTLAKLAWVLGLTLSLAGCLDVGGSHDITVNIDHVNLVGEDLRLEPNEALEHAPDRYAYPSSISVMNSTMRPSFIEVTTDAAHT